MHWQPTHLWRMNSITPENGQSLQKQCWENWICIFRSMKQDFCPIQKQSKNKNWRPETIQLLDGTIEETLPDTGKWYSFSDWTPDVQAIKEKNRQLGLCQAKKLLHSEGNTQQVQEATERTREYIYKQQWSNPVKKWTQDLNQSFSKDKIQMLMNTWKNAQYHWSSERCK